MTRDPKDLLLRLFGAAVDSADPAKTVARHLPEIPRGRIVVVGAGKSAAAMARAVEDAWPGVDLSGWSSPATAMPCRPAASR